MKLPPWFDGNAFLLDLETTGPEPFDARMVTATCIEVSPKGVVSTVEFLINPGIDIPAEATAIHGVTNERVKADGRPVDVALSAILALMGEAWRRGLPLIAMNANYDLTCIDCELSRQGRSGLAVGPVLDPFVIDRACDPYRKGKRTLAATCARYGVKQEGAHSSTGDALAAGRLIWKLAQLSTGSRSGFKKLGRYSLDQMQRWQKDAHYARQVDYERYSKEQGRVGRDGKPEVVEKDWPIRGAREIDPTGGTDSFIDVMHGNSSL